MTLFWFNFVLSCLLEMWIEIQKLQIGLKWDYLQDTLESSLIHGMEISAWELKSLDAIQVLFIY